VDKTPQVPQQSGYNPSIAAGAGVVKNAGISFIENQENSGKQVSTESTQSASSESASTPSASSQSASSQSASTQSGSSTTQSSGGSSTSHSTQSASSQSGTPSGVGSTPHTVSSLDEYDGMLEARIKSSIDSFTNAVNQINRISELPKRTDVRPLAESMSKIQAIQDVVEAAMKAQDDFDAKQTARVDANVARLMEIVREEEARLHKAEDDYQASIQPVIDDAERAFVKGESALDQSLRNTAASLGLSIASLGTSATTVSHALSTISHALKTYMEKAIRAEIALNNPELATVLGIPKVTDPSSSRLPPPPQSNSNDLQGSVAALVEESPSLLPRDLNMGQGFSRLFDYIQNGGVNLMNMNNQQTHV